MKLSTWLGSSGPVQLTVDPDEFRPMSDLDHFVSKTKTMLNGLDSNIEALDREITERIAQLNDLRKIRSAQQLALNFMEGE